MVDELGTGQKVRRASLASFDASACYTIRKMRNASFFLPLHSRMLPTDATRKQVSGPNGKAIAAPSSKLSKPPPRRNWVPAPDVQRIGPGAETPDGNPHAYRRTTLQYIKAPSPAQWGDDVSMKSAVSWSRDSSRKAGPESNTPRSEQACNDSNTRKIFHADERPCARRQSCLR